MDCDAQWVVCKGKNPYRYLQGFDLEMKACIEHLWPIVHQHKMPSTTISLVFGKGILAEPKKLEVGYASHTAFTNKLQSDHTLVQKDFCPPTPHEGIANLCVNVNNVKGKKVLFGKGAWKDWWIQERHNGCFCKT
jgi:hypothetical protein